MTNERHSDGGIDVLEPEREQRLERPRHYKVIYLNDDYTSMDFVQRSLEQHFHKTREEAAKLTWEIHKEGMAIVAVLPLDVAETKQYIVISEARKCGFPLFVVLEKTSE